MLSPLKKLPILVISLPSKYLNDTKESLSRIHQNLLYPARSHFFIINSSITSFPFQRSRINGLDILSRKLCQSFGSSWNVTIIISKSYIGQNLSIFRDIRNSLKFFRGSQQDIFISGTYIDFSISFFNNRKDCLRSDFLGQNQSQYKK